MKKYFISALAIILVVVTTYFVTDHYSSRRARIDLVASMYNMKAIDGIHRISSWDHVHMLLTNGCIEQALEYVNNEQSQGLTLLNMQLKNGVKIDKATAKIYSPIINKAKAFTRRAQQQVSRCDAIPDGFYTYGNDAVTNPGQLWAIKLSGIPMQINHDSNKYLAPGERTAQNQVSIHAMLAKSWGVNNRTDLLNTIKVLQVNGDAPVFMNLVKIVKEGLSAGKSIQAILAERRESLSQTNYGYLVFIANHIHKYEGKDLILWDWGRIISLVRWGYEVGYLGEVEAWSIIMPLAEQLRIRYSSWKEYGQLYALTRATWAAGFGKGDIYYSMTNKITAQLLATGGAWALSPWPTAPVTTLISRLN